MGGSIKTAGSIYTGGSFSTSLTLKSTILFVLRLLKKFMFWRKRFTFLPSLRESIFKNFHFFIISRTRGWNFSGAQFPPPRCENWAAHIKRDSWPLISNFFSKLYKDLEDYFSYMLCLNLVHHIDMQLICPEPWDI